MRIYAVLDCKAEAYLQPIFAPTNAVAKRIFIEAALDQNHNFHKYAADYTLFEIGKFDEETANITAIPPNNLGNALQLTAIHSTEPGQPGDRLNKPDGEQDGNQ